MNQAYSPTKKIAAAAGIGIPLAGILAWVLSLYGIEMPRGVEASAGAVLSSLIGYFVRETQP